MNHNLDSLRLENLLHLAEHGHDITRYGGHKMLYVDAHTYRIIDADAPALEWLGYARDDLLRLTIADLEIHNDPAAPTRTYVETSIEEQVYESIFRHRLGHQLPVQVRRRRLQPNGSPVFHYRLEDTSLYQRVWQELQRREDNGFVFQQKLKLLNEITIKLSRIDSYDELCRQVIQLGIDHLGFDRMGMWFLDVERSLMIGSYGVDEQGVVRPEHDQRWSYHDTYIADFFAGKTDAAIAYDNAPIYNEKSEIIHYGWHISAPMLHGNQFIGILSSDNYLHHQPIKSYEPELLRQYGITVGHLTELARAREQGFAMRLAQERTHLLRQFITNVGHEFKTPLSVINVKSFLTQHAQASTDRQSLAGDIQDQVMYISTMLDKMLEFIALESHLALTLAPTDLHKLLLEVSISYRQAKRIQFEITSANAAIVSADAHYLSRALSEILDNAVLYTPEGGQVEASIVHYPNQIGIRIRDTGIGINAVYLDQIFNPLYRVDQARTERHVGLGLALAKMIVEAHQGRITVTSTPGIGSTFEIILPQE